MKPIHTLKKDQKVLAFQQQKKKIKQKGKFVGHIKK